jgi:hypothetical protein
MLIFLFFFSCVHQTKADPRLRSDQREPFLIQKDIIDEWIDYFKDKIFSKNDLSTKQSHKIQTDNKKVRNSFLVFCFIQKLYHVEFSMKHENIPMFVQDFET